jgi:DNA polymerase kappa
MNENDNNIQRTIRSSNKICNESSINILFPQAAQNQSNFVTRNETSREASALLVAASDKAGMQGIDRSRIDTIILRESANSSYMKYQRKQDEQVNQRIATMKIQVEQQRRQMVKNHHDWKATLEKDLEKEIHIALRSRPTRSVCCVVDMDMFYMACELLSKPEYSDKPCCVGRSLITTSNYVARKYGVRAAMAGFIADKLVYELSDGKESLIHFPSNFPLYKEKAEQVRNVLQEFDPNLKTYSLDEASLDLSRYLYFWLQGKTHNEIVQMLKEGNTPPKVGSHKTTAFGESPLAEYSSAVSIEAAETVLQDMRQRVFHATGGLTCSAGIAPNFMLAKIASDQNKPNGQTIVGPTPSQVLAFLHPLSTRKVPGIGRVTEKLLQAWEVSTVQQLYEQRALVRLAFSRATARFLLLASVGCTSSRTDENQTKRKDYDDNNHNNKKNGIDNDNTDTKNHDNNDESRKGMSRERTFSSGVSWPEVLTILEQLAQRLSQDLKSEFRCARTLTFKVKLKSFDVMSRSRSMPTGCYMQTTEELMKLASSLLYEWKTSGKYSSTSIRLLGIRCSNFCREADKLASPHRSIQYYMQKKQPSKVEDTSTAEESISTISTSSNTSIEENQQKILRCDESPDKKHESFTATKSLSCPVCGIQFLPSSSNESINNHIDDCLNRPLLEDTSSVAIMQHQNYSTCKKKRQRLEDFFPRKSRK